MRASVLLLALLFDAPFVWQACIDQTVSVETAVIRFLIAVPVAWLLVTGVRIATRRTGPPAA
jgi:hypothetical protein